MLEIICVPAIVAVVFMLMEIYKKVIAKGREKYLTLIPVIAGVLGMVFGVVFFYAFPSIIGTSNLAYAIVLGLFSGLSATGCNQIFKQLKKFGIEVKQPVTEKAPAKAK